MKKSAFIISCTLLFTVIVLFLMACGGSKNAAGNAASEVAITNSLDSNQWQFIPYQVNPQTGRSRQVNGNYSVVRRDNKLTVYLPYFGTAIGGANIFSNKSPLDFISVDFIADQQKPSATEWRITVKPKDSREVQTMNFTLFSNGSASLSVTMTNRSGISFTGRIEPAKKQ